MVAKEKQNKVHVGAQGRVVIPAHIRKELDISAGETLIARVEDGKLVLEKRENILARLQGMFTKASRGASLVDELIAERREEARREIEE
jgi:AbrB family looped-hinge helix DNA binding protein